MNADDDIEVAEYVLGTLPADERARLALKLAGDAALRDVQRFWEGRLAPLDAHVPPQAPSPGVWEAIERATALRAGRNEPAAVAAGSNVVDLERRLAWWRGGALAAAALAAGLAGVVVLDRAAVPPEPADGRYMAVVDTGGREPALIAEVDTAAGVIRVRSVAVETPAGHSLELWHIADGGKPRSLGVLAGGTDAQVIRDAVTAGPVNGIIAVTVEPAGGSPSGDPTGAPVYSGRLIAVD